MSITKGLVRLAAVGVSLFLAACGGGGGGGGGGGSGATSQPSGPPPYTLTPATATASFVAGYPSAINLTARQTVTFTGLVYVKITADAPVVQAITVTSNSDGSLEVTAQPLASLAVGHYTGNFRVDVCSDVNCASPLAGSPFNVPYDFTVISPDGGVTTWNLSTLSPLAGATDWGTFQGNAAHTGFVPVTLDATAFNRRWKWDAPAYSGVQWNPSALTTGAGLFYVSSGPSYDARQAGHELFAYKEADGSKAWSHSFADLTYATTNPPAFAGGKVFIAAGSQESTAMFAFDAATGVQDFKTQMASQWEHYYAPTIFNGAVYTDGGEYGGMYAFDTTTGAQDFFTGVAQWDGWTPALDATHAYAYTAGNLGIFDNQTGAFIANIADPTYSWNGYTSDCAPVLGAPGIVYAGDLGLTFKSANSITSFDTESKTARWSISGVYSGNPAYAGGLLYAANSAPFQLEAWNESDGTRAWAWTPPAGNGNFVSDVLVTNNLVFVSTLANTYAVDRNTHQSVWSYAASGSLALSANGILYIKGSTSIVAINLH